MQFLIWFLLFFLNIHNSHEWAPCSEFGPTLSAVPQRPHYQTLGELLENPDVISLIEVSETSAEEEATATVQVHQKCQETIQEMKPCSTQGPEYTDDAILVPEESQTQWVQHGFYVHDNMPAVE